MVGWHPYSPPTTSMFIILGFAPVAAAVGVGEYYIALFVAALYQFAHRLFMIWYFVKKQGIKAFPSEDLKPLSTSIKEGWTSILLYLGAIIPLVLTIGPLATFLENTSSIGEAGLDSIDIVVWIPTLMILISIILGWKHIPKNTSDLFSFITKSIPRFTTIGALIFFAVAASEVL